MKKTAQNDEVQRLQARIKDLEKASTFSRLKTKARKRMIDQAEGLR